MSTMHCLYLSADRRVQTNCPRSLRDSATADSSTCELPITSASSWQPDHVTQSSRCPAISDELPFIWLTSTCHQNTWKHAVVASQLPTSPCTFHSLHTFARCRYWTLSGGMLFLDLRWFNFANSRCRSVLTVSTQRNRYNMRTCKTYFRNLANKQINRRHQNNSSLVGLTVTGVKHDSAYFTMTWPLTPATPTACCDTRARGSVRPIMKRDNRLYVCHNNRLLW